VKGVEGEQVKE